ncbi:AbrB family transcriptional regulator [Oceanibacterium hippocampi]|uniref:Putative ammonia monooxygenase n=1 Tax=Oceanibacterium hippocampi TaxID=745714 RepID=A0A1Y5TUC4_9PROT|nr:AbrB family transcriptional regulator [Oceanibacterium hippocampi]SLN71963.1 Putative ammonia monooxygenase [Oceanibacterium hippocampi]
MHSATASLTLTFFFGGLGGYLVSSLGVPGGWIIGSIAATFTASVLKPQAPIPAFVRSLAMGFAGMIVGAAIKLELLVSAAVLPLSLLAMFLLLALLAWLTYLLHRISWNASRATAISCAWPGNILLALVGAQAMQADMSRVTVVQLVRVLMLMGLLPLTIGTFHAAPPVHNITTSVDLAIASAVTIACVLLARRINLLGGEMFFAAIAVGALSAGGILNFEIPSPALAGLQVLVGNYIGLGLALCKRETFFAALIPSLLGAVMATAITLAGAFALAGVLDYPAAALALAYAPGGAEAMILLSAVFDVDPGFVGIHHTLRLIVLTFSFPFILRYFARATHQATGSR